MSESEMTRYLIETFASVETSTAMGYTFFFYGSERKMPFATLSSSDNDYDRISHLDRPGVYRLNIGVKKETYCALFGPHPAAPGASGIVNTGHDFTTLDTLMPHPVYAPQSWICVLSPSESTFPTLQPLIAEAYELAVKRQSRG